MNSLRKTFANNLRRVHDESGYMQKHVAKVLHISTQALANWFSGTRFPQPETIEQLSEFYGVDWLEFFLPESNKE